MRYKFIYSLLVLSISVSILTTSCSSDDKHRDPGHIYAPDMTYSRAYETYTEDPIFADSLTNRKPVHGTVSMDGTTSGELNPADSGIAFAMTSHLPMTKANVAEGKRLYDIHCAVCHGMKLDGQGPLFTSGKYPLAPANLTDPKFVAYSEGRLYYTIMFGKNMMGSYSSQLDETQRWLVVDYIKNFTGVKNLDGASTAIATTESDSTKL